ncbi:MAG: hypothetical protein LBC19_05860 [Tannerella sp.]|nr:hypothetical protein [Tannerella sp.]
MRSVKMFLILCLFSPGVPFFAFAQNSGGQSDSDDSGEGKKIWEPDLVELWIYWHKQQYRMFQRFSHHEDTLQRVQYQNYQDRMRDLREVDEILFNQHQDNDIPKLPFLAPDAAYATVLSMDVLEITKETGNMLMKEPYDRELFDFYVESSIRTAIRFGTLVQTTVKALDGWKRTNLRDNDFRDNLTDYVIKELESIVGEWNLLYRRFETGKHIQLLNSQ